MERPQVLHSKRALFNFWEGWYAGIICVVLLTPLKAFCSIRVLQQSALQVCTWYNITIQTAAQNQLVKYQSVQPLFRNTRYFLCRENTLSNFGRINVCTFHWEQTGMEVCYVKSSPKHNVLFLWRSSTQKEYSIVIRKRTAAQHFYVWKQSCEGEKHPRPSQVWTEVTGQTLAAMSQIANTQQHL